MALVDAWPADWSDRMRGRAGAMCGDGHLLPFPDEGAAHMAEKDVQRHVAALRQLIAAGTEG